MDISTLNSHYERLQQLSKNEGTLDGLKSGAANCIAGAVGKRFTEARVKYIARCHLKAAFNHPQ